MDPPRMPLPRFLQIEPVGQCNLRCKMCPIQFRRDGPPHGPPAFMDFNLFMRLPRTRPRAHPPGTPGPDRCDWPWRGAYVSYQGLAMPCCIVATPDRITLGDMAADGVEAVWNGANYREFRAALASETPPEVGGRAPCIRERFDLKDSVGGRSPRLQRSPLVGL